MPACESCVSNIVHRLHVIRLCYAAKPAKVKSDFQHKSTIPGFERIRQIKHQWKTHCQTKPVFLRFPPHPACWARDECNTPGHGEIRSPGGDGQGLILFGEAWLSSRCDAINPPSPGNEALTPRCSLRPGPLDESRMFATLL